MQLGKTLNSMINDQIGRELGASNQYVQIATFFDMLGFENLAKEFYDHGVEERGHAVKFVEYLVDTNSPVLIPVVVAPRYDLMTTFDIAKFYVEFERTTTDWIDKLVKQALLEADHTTFQFLQWYVNEQIEEESAAEKFLSLVQKAGDGVGLLMLDDMIGDQKD